MRVLTIHCRLNVRVDLLSWRALPELMTDVAIIMLILMLVIILVSADFMPYRVHFFSVLSGLVGLNGTIVI